MFLRCLNWFSVLVGRGEVGYAEEVNTEHQLKTSQSGIKCAGELGQFDAKFTFTIILRRKVVFYPEHFCVLSFNVCQLIDIEIFWSHIKCAGFLCRMWVQTTYLASHFSALIVFFKPQHIFDLLFRVLSFSHQVLLRAQPVHIKPGLQLCNLCSAGIWTFF